jgi:hypothetical protein
MLIGDGSLRFAGAAVAGAAPGPRRVPGRQPCAGATLEIHSVIMNFVLWIHRRLDSCAAIP